MKKQIIYLLTGCSLSLVQCTSEKLSHEQALQLLEETRAYPQAVDYRIFCGNTETAEKIRETELDEQGFVNVQLKHTTADVGKPLVTFNEKSQPYLITTSDTAKAMDVQRVRLADEAVHEIKNVAMSKDGKKALIEYSTKIQNTTPFIVLLNGDSEKTNARQTHFTLTDEGWKWDGKIIKVSN